MPSSFLTWSVKLLKMFPPFCMHYLSSTMEYTIVFLVFFVILSLYARRRWYTLVFKRLRLPPGPAGLPFLGNLYDMPHDHTWLTFANWAREFGDVVYVEVFGNPTIILNSVKATTEFFEKRSSNYADRPRMASLSC